MLGEWKVGKGERKVGKGERKVGKGDRTVGTVEAGGEGRQAGHPDAITVRLRPRLHDRLGAFDNLVYLKTSRTDAQISRLLV